MWIYFLIVGLLLYYYTYEPMTTSPYEMVQEQAGTIQYLHNTISSMTMSASSLDSLQQENDTMTDQINQLQTNLPSKEPSKQYPKP
jgi:Tfp pilus assembly protein PilO